MPCEANVPADRRADWLKWCRGVDPTLANHRILRDGLGSRTLFNGHEMLTDLLYTKANTYVSGQWREAELLVARYMVGRMGVCEDGWVCG